MANGYILNQIPTTYGAAISLLVEMLAQAGWTYQASGDGLSGYSAIGKVFTNTGSGALGWDNSKAWARMQDPGGGRELVFQNGASSQVRFKYSPTARFTGGTPSATITPFASDERVILGSGTDASPIFSSFWSTAVTTGGLKFQGRANGTAPYGFWYASATTPGGAMNAGLTMDPVTSVPEDPDPVVFHHGTSSRVFCRPGAFGSTGAMTSTSWNTSTSGCCLAFMDVNKLNWLTVMPAQYTVGTTVNGGNLQTATDGWIIREDGITDNPFNTKAEALPIMYLRATVTSLASPFGIKGWSTLARWTGFARNTFLDTLDNKQWICVGDVWLPWDGVTTPTN